MRVRFGGARGGACRGKTWFSHRRCCKINKHGAKIVENRVRDAAGDRKKRGHRKRHQKVVHKSQSTSPRGSKRIPQINRKFLKLTSVFRLISRRCVFLPCFYQILERFGSQNDGKNNGISRKNAPGEQSGNFPKNVVFYWFLQYIHEVRMYEINVKKREIPICCAENVARKKTAEV